MNVIPSIFRYPNALKMSLLPLSVDSDNNRTPPGIEAAFFGYMSLLTLPNFSCIVSTLLTMFS